MNKKLKQFISILLIITVVSVLIVTAINIYMINYSAKYIVDSVNDLSNTVIDSFQTVIVFRAYVYDNGQPCPMLEDRLLTGINVLESGITERIVLSGDYGTRGYDEINSMKKFVFEHGIDKEAVCLDYAGFSTYDSIVRASKIFQVESAALVTQRYHLSRAVYIARKNGIEAYGIAADLRDCPKREMVRYIIREWLARTKDFFFVNLIKPDPVFLGDEIPITGKSEPSYDIPEDLN
ncbi:MAG: YdcF family protein [Clostridiales bacterium]|nr:YdcF family protein [Clostridiales bacterium]